jgi:hypothetical protein
MSIQRSGLELAVATVALAAAALAPTAGAAASGCAPNAAKILKSSGAARIYAKSGTLYGCLGTEATRLGSLQGTHLAPATRVVRYVLASPFAGVNTVQMGVDTFASTVSMVDLRTGATITRSQATTPMPQAESFSTVKALAIDHLGVIAWIGKRTAIGDPDTIYELHVDTRKVSGTMAGGTAPISQLSLSDKTLSYRIGGKLVVIPVADLAR